MVRERRAGGDPVSANLQVVGLANNSTAAQAEAHLSGLNPNSALGATSPSYAGKRVAVFTSGGDDVDGCSLPF